MDASITSATNPTSGALILLALAIPAGYSVYRSAKIEDQDWLHALPSALFGIWLLASWEILVRMYEISPVLLPAPSSIGQSLWAHLPLLWDDFRQTVGKAVLTGWVIGCGIGFMVAIAIDRLPFLQRGLLPLAALTSAIPLVGVAPIAVMLWGFDWQSKAAVVALMTFFPMLISTLAGLQSAGKLERELMHSYAAGYMQTLLTLRLPSSVPHIFNALKVNASLALIGAIVAEFFGSPTHGLGFRISTEAAKLNMPLVWSAIVVAAITGSVAFSLLRMLEQRSAFWHPSIRGQ